MRIWIQAARTASAIVGLLAGAGAVEAQRMAPCAAGRAEGTGVVEGMVVDRATRVPLIGAKVEISWRGEGDPRKEMIELATDGVGAFRFCEAPVDMRLMVKASFAGKSSRSEPLLVGGGGNARAVLEIDAPHAEIVGRVVEYRSGRPIASATVRLAGTPLRQVTPEDGRFRFMAVPPGRYEVAIEHMGYLTVSDSIDLELGTNMDVTAHLAPNAIPLEPLVVTVRSAYLERRGFYERQRRGLGSYVTRDEIDRTPLLASDLLRGLAGISLVRRGAGFGYAPVGRANCGFRYVLDGVRVGPDFEIDDISPEWIDAVEVYRGAATVPMEFAALGDDRRGACGVIVIWTRNR